MAKDTFVLKLLDLLEFAEMRSKDIKPEDTGYIGKKEVMEMIKRDPKIMTNDMRNKIRPMCETLEKRPDFSKADVNEIIKNNPHIFRNSIKKINMLEIIGENFLIRKGIEYVDLFKYILIFKPHMLAMNPERLYKRLYPIVNIKKSTIITEEDLNDISKRGKEDEITTDDSQIAFPEYDPRNPEKFRTEIKKNLNVKRDKVKEQ